MNVTVDISKKPLLESLLIVEFSEGSIDLHNDFDCIGISMIGDNLQFHFLNAEKRKVEIVLLTSEIIRQEVKFNFSGSLTLDNFYKGRIEGQNKLQDFDVRGRHCFYFHFCEDVYLEVLAKTAMIIFEKADSAYQDRSTK